MSASEKAREICTFLSDHGWGYCRCSACERYTPPIPVEVIARALEETRESALEEAANVAQGPDEGYLHGCHCRGSIRALQREKRDDESLSS